MLLPNLVLALLLIANRHPLTKVAMQVASQHLLSKEGTQAVNQLLPSREVIQQASQPADLSVAPVAAAVLPAVADDLAASG